MITTLRIAGMTCNGCVKHVGAALRAVPGVSAVEVSLAESSAQVVFEPERSSLDSLVDAVRAAGYAAVPAAVPAG